jgi:hypothetical protein
VGNAIDTPPFAVGMFVAGGDIVINAKQTVGVLISEKGSIRAQQLLHNPYFSTASIYMPKRGPNWNTLAWFTAIFDLAYADDSKKALEIGPGAYHVTSQGVTQQ